jgi:RNA polymerase sigma factor (TIGR02999 family)
MSEPQALTRLLNLAAGGDQDAVKAVFPLIYAELKRIARARRARAGAGDTFRTTALVHEAYLRLVAKQDLAFNGRHHFFCTAARAMRDLLVEEARKRSRQKRGGDLQRVELEEIGQTLDTSPEDLLALDAALERLKAEDADDHEVVMLRYFAGLTVEEIADLRSVSTRTIERRWRFCRAWLARELGVDPARP